MSTTISKPGPREILLMLLTALIWASAFSAIKVVVPESGPLWLAAWRVLIGFLVMFPYVLWRGLIFPSTGKLWFLILLTSIFNVVIPFFLISWSEQTIDSGVVAVLMGCGPFLALLGSHFFTSDDRITPPKILGVLLGFSGVLMIVGYDALSGLGGATLMAQLAALGGACSYAVSGLLVRRVDFPPIRFGFFVLGMGAIILITLSLLIQGKPNLDLSLTAGLALLYLGILPTGAGQILRFVLIKKVGYSAFSLSLNLIPVFGVGLGALLLGEIIGPQMFIALALVLGGLLVSRMDWKSRYGRSQSGDIS